MENNLKHIADEEFLECMLDESIEDERERWSVCLGKYNKKDLIDSFDAYLEKRKVILSVDKKYFSKTYIVELKLEDLHLSTKNKVLEIYNKDTDKIIQEQTSLRSWLCKHGRTYIRVTRGEKVIFKELICMN